MSPSWSHLTCPPQPPFPVPVSDNVFLPLPCLSSGAFLRTSSSEPTLHFVLKGLGVLSKEEKYVKVSEVKTRRRNTLLVTPGEVSKTRSLTFVPSQGPRPSLSGFTSISIGSSSSGLPITSAPPAAPFMPKLPLPHTPQPMIHSRMPTDHSTPSTCASDESYDSCSDHSAFSTPSSGHKMLLEQDGQDDEYSCAREASSPCPHPSPRKIGRCEVSTTPPAAPPPSAIKRPRLSPASASRETRTKEGRQEFKIWRSPPSVQVPSSPFEDDRLRGLHQRQSNGFEGREIHLNVKRRRISQIEWEGLPCPEHLVSPKTVLRVNELGAGFSWTSLA